MKLWSPSWKSSKLPRKQRKYRFTAPLHIKSHFLSSHLSKELRKKYGRRAIRIRKGDRVTIVRGQFRKISGKIERIDLKNSKVFIEKVEVIKKDGNKSFYPIDSSNIIITELVLTDKKRVNMLERVQKKKTASSKTNST